MSATPMIVQQDKREQILLLNPPFRDRILRDYYCCTHSKSGYLWHPTDLLVQSGILGAAQNISVIDAVALNMSRKDALHSAINANPSTVFSLIGSLSLESDIRFLDELKMRTGARIIVSGDVCLQRPGFFLREHPCLDAVLLNFTSKDILRIVNGKIAEIDSSAIRTDGGILVKLKPTPFEFECPPPLRASFKNGAYNLPFAPAGFDSVLASFGCSYSCSFCNSGARSLGYSRRNPDNLAEEIDILLSQNVKHIFFKDMTFGIDRKNVARVCLQLANSSTQVTWRAYTRLDLLDTARIEMYANAGCRLLQIGLETPDADAAKKVGKPIDMARAKEMFDLMKTKGITPGAHFIIGLPGARVGSALRTARIATKLSPGYTSFNIFSPRPGSELFESGGRPAGDTIFWRLMTRAAYAIFYLNPRRAAALTTKKTGGQSLIRAIRYFLFLPDSKSTAEDRLRKAWANRLKRS